MRIDKETNPLSLLGGGGCCPSPSVGERNIQRRGLLAGSVDKCVTIFLCSGVRGRGEFRFPVLVSFCAVNTPPPPKLF